MKPLCELFIVMVALAADPPTMKELSPVPKNEPPPSAAVAIDVERYRWYAIDGYKGEVTWEIDGESIGVKEVSKALTLFGKVQGQTEPGEYDVPVGAAIVWGKQKGVTKLTAYGVVNGKAKRLFSKSFEVDGSAPIPPPKPDPVVGKLAGWVLIEETSKPFLNRGAILTVGIQWSKENGIGYRTADQHVKDSSGQPPLDIVSYLAAAQKAGIPQLFLVTAEGKALYAGPVPSSSDEFVALLKKHKGP